MGGSNSPSTYINLNTSKGGAIASGGSTSIPTSPTSDCGTTTAETKRAPADVLIVLDRSESMIWSITADNVTCTAGDPNCSSRLAVVVPAVGAVVTDNSSINWGLEFFTTPNSSGYCVVSSTPQVPVGPNTAAAIKAQLAAVSTQLSTPTTAAINVATAYLKTVNDGNNKVILLASDGEPNCAGYTATTATGGGSMGWTTDDIAGTTTAVTAAKNAGFPVYVIGIGPTAGVANLNSLAVVGGTKAYYPVTSTAELSAALASIAKVVSATCTFKAATVPPDKNLVYVYVDKKLVTKDDSNGWKFDSTDTTYSTIVLTGSYCDDMMANVTSQVQIVFGCPDVAPVLVIP